MLEEPTRELQDLQEELVRKEKLAILGQLAGGVGHELCNPLGVITNAVYYLTTVLPDSDELVREGLETGAIAALTKPLQIEKLLRILEEVHRQELVRSLGSRLEREYK